MKVFTEKADIRQELTGVRCNKCGRDLQKNEAGYFEDYLQIEKTWGYHSPMDGDRHEIDLCIDCYSNWVKEFKIPPDSEQDHTEE